MLQVQITSLPHLCQSSTARKAAGPEELGGCAGFKLPDPNSPVYDQALDYQDVKLKIIQQEGYDAHDFNLFDDRASLLWRKPYVDGAVRELTAGNNGRSVEQLRRAVEQLMLAAGNRNPNVRAIQAPAHRSRSNIKVDVDVDQQEALIKDMRRNPEKYRFPHSRPLKNLVPIFPRSPRPLSTLLPPTLTSRPYLYES